MIKKRGLKGAIFGATITRTVGELELAKNGPMRTILKFHCLESAAAGAPTVGIEVITRSVASYHMFPIRLTAEQVGVVKDLLSQTVAESQAHSVPMVTRDKRNYITRRKIPNDAVDEH